MKGREPRRMADAGHTERVTIVGKEGRRNGTMCQQKHCDVTMNKSKNKKCVR